MSIGAKLGQADARCTKNWGNKCRMDLQLKVSENKMTTKNGKDDDCQDGRRLKERTTGQTTGPKGDNERTQEWRECQTAGAD